MLRKLRLISKFMKSQAGHQVITIHILFTISRSEDSQTMKFGQLLENKIKYIVFEKSYTKCCGEACPRPFYKK